MPRNAIIVTLLAFCFFEKGLGNDEEFRCPDPFRPEKVNTLTYQVNTTAIKEANCELATRRLTFSVNRNNNFDTICNIAYECSSPGPVTDPTPEKAECGCVRKSGEVWTFEVKLYVDQKKDTGAGFGFNVCSGADKPPSQYIQTSCTDISIIAVLQPTSTDPLTTEVDATSTKSTPHPGAEEDGLGTGVIVGIVVGVVILVAVIVGICCFMKKRG